MGADGLLLELIFALCVAGALAGIVVPDRRNPALLAWVGSFASLLTLWVAGNVLWSGQIFQAELWTIRGWGPLTVSLDRLSALFLAVAAVVVLASSVFSAGYLKRYSGHYNLKALNAWYLLLFASIVLILIANDMLLFLLAWEAMSILSYLLVNFEHRRDETSRAGYLMLAMGEAGFVAVALVFLFLAVKAGSLDFAAFKTAGANCGSFTRWTIFLLTFFGFGVKAGLVPVNTWLPRAHPAAPANVSAILSGTILNLGLYGIVRVNLDLAPVTQNGMIGAGVVVLIVGTISALVGILYATTENDLKAMLAHSSIENIVIQRPLANCPGASCESPTSTVGSARFINQASLRILLSDKTASLMNLPGVSTETTSVQPFPLDPSAASPPFTVTSDACHPPMAQSPGTSNYMLAANKTLLGGYIKIEMQLNSTPGTWKDVTQEILNLGISRDVMASGGAGLERRR